MIATSASSYVDSSSEECFPSYAVDGLWWANQYDPFSCNILSTQDEKHPWFALDLLTEKMVTGVNLKSRRLSLALLLTIIISDITTEQTWLLLGPSC